jgi:hypothetical protein
MTFRFERSALKAAARLRLPSRRTPRAPKILSRAARSSFRRQLTRAPARSRISSGTTLLPSANAGETSTAVSVGALNTVWNNAFADPSFGVTSAITLSDRNPANAAVLASTSFLSQCSRCVRAAAPDGGQRRDRARALDLGLDGGGVRRSRSGRTTPRPGRDSRRRLIGLATKSTFSSQKHELVISFLVVLRKMRRRLSGNALGSMKQ